MTIDEEPISYSQDDQINDAEKELAEIEQHAKDYKRAVFNLKERIAYLQREKKRATQPRLFQIALTIQEIDRIIAMVKCSAYDYDDDLIKKLNLMRQEDSGHD